MKITRTRLHLFLLLGCIAAITACSGKSHDPVQAKSSAPPRYVAIARGQINVEGGLLPLSTEVSGVIAELHVHDGDHVRPDQVLASLQSDDARAAVTVAQGRLDQAKAQARLIGMQLKAARRHAKTLAAAAAAGADAGQNAVDASNQVQQLDAQQASAKAAVTVARGHLQKARRALALHQLRAPVAAQVTRVHVQPGEVVTPQSGPLFTLLPDAPRIVVAELNSDYVKDVHKGMQAQVVLDNANENVVGAAHVTLVGQVYGPSTLEPDPSLRANTRTVRCLLRFDHPTASRIGQRVLVRFLPDHNSGH